MIEKETVVPMLSDHSGFFEQSETLQYNPSTQSHTSPLVCCGVPIDVPNPIYWLYQRLCQCFCCCDSYNDGYEMVHRDNLPVADAK